MCPIENLKRGYGSIKVYENNKLRPKISSLNSVTSGHLFEIINWPSQLKFKIYFGINI